MFVSNGLPSFVDGPEIVDVQQPDSLRNKLLPYGYRTLPALRARSGAGLGAAAAEYGVWPGRQTIFSSKPTYGWPLGAEDRSDPIAMDAWFWGKSLAAAIATFSGLYLLARL